MSKLLNFIDKVNSFMSSRQVYAVERPSGVEAETFLKESQDRHSRVAERARYDRERRARMA